MKDRHYPTHWVSFLDEHHDTWLFNQDFLLSKWTCIYGQGCPGIGATSNPAAMIGCCEHGAHFADKADRKKTQHHIARLAPTQWQFHDLAHDLDGPLGKNEDGDWVTKTHDGACILLNRPGFAGGAGCALHTGALDAGESPREWKPEVCWQVPLRLVVLDDELGQRTHILRPWGRRDWGEGGEDFHWWCTDQNDREHVDAFINDDTVVRSLKGDIIALIGEPHYERLLNILGDGVNQPIQIRTPQPYTN